MTTLSNAYGQWLKLQPWDEQTQHKIRRRFTIDFNYNSNRMEGNTLTYGQTELLLLFGMMSGEARMKDCEDMKASNIRLRRHFLGYFTKLTTEAIDAEVHFATIHDERIWWHDGEMVRFRTGTRGRILSAIMTNTGMSTKEISELTGVNVAAVNKHLKALADKQYIQRKGDGDWHVIIYPSL